MNRRTEARLSVTLTTAEAEALFLVIGNTADYEDALNSVLSSPKERNAAKIAIMKLEKEYRKAKARAGK